MTFDAESFLNSTLTSDAGSTELDLPPEGTYPMTVLRVEPRQFESDKGVRRVLELTWKIDADALEEGQSPFARQTLWLDFDEFGAFDTRKGKNLDLNRVREALNQNTPGRPWAPAMLVDGYAMGQVYHRADREDPERKFLTVRRITRVS